MALAERRRLASPRALRLGRRRLRLRLGRARGVRGARLLEVEHAGLRGVEVSSRVGGFGFGSRGGAAGSFRRRLRGRRARVRVREAFARGGFHLIVEGGAEGGEFGGGGGVGGGGVGGGGELGARGFESTGGRRGGGGGGGDVRGGVGGGGEGGGGVGSLVEVVEHAHEGGLGEIDAGRERLDLGGHGFDERLLVSLGGVGGVRGASGVAERALDGGAGLLGRGHLHRRVAPLLAARVDVEVGPEGHRRANLGELRGAQGVLRDRVRVPALVHHSLLHRVVQLVQGGVDETVRLRRELRHLLHVRHDAAPRRSTGGNALRAREPGHPEHFEEARRVPRTGPTTDTRV